MYDASNAECSAKVQERCKTGWENLSLVRPLNEEEVISHRPQDDWHSGLTELLIYFICETVNSDLTEQSSSGAINLSPKFGLCLYAVHPKLWS